MRLSIHEGICFFQGLSIWYTKRYTSNAAPMIAFFVNVISKDNKKGKPIRIYSNSNYIFGDKSLRINFVVGGDKIRHNQSIVYLKIILINKKLFS